MKKKILIAIVVLFIAIQFVRPTKNISTTNYSAFLEKYPMDSSTLPVWQNACADCHSDNTTYPWYAEIQPVGFWITNHVNEGKRKFNINRIQEKPLKKQLHKLDEFVEMLNEGEMPLKSYTWIHKNAVLSDVQKTALVQWAKSTKDKLGAE